MEDAGLFYGHFVYFKAIWYILRPFGIFYDCYIFSRFGTLYEEKSGNPAEDGCRKRNKETVDNEIRKKLFAKTQQLGDAN
jgi:hypothetical protein